MMQMLLVLICVGIGIVAPCCVDGLNEDGTRADNVLGNNEKSTIALKAQKDAMEQSLKFLSKYCDLQLMKCENIPENITLGPMFSDNLWKPSSPGVDGGRNGSCGIFTGNTSHRVHDWEKYVDPGVLRDHKYIFAPNISGQSTVRLYEGDLLNNLELGNGSGNRKAINKLARWPDATVPFIIDEAITDFNLRDVILEAMIMISNESCINFVEANLVIHTEHVVFVKGHQYAASVGRGVRQLVTVLDEPVRKETRGQILHLLMHVLGFGHEHNRPDRDQFVWINCSNTEVITNTSFQYVDAPYDFDSITHNGVFDYAVDPRFPAILPKVIGKKIGQREYLSRTDFHKINTLYECPSNAVNNTSGTRAALGKRHSGAETDLVIEDSSIRYGTTVIPNFTKFSTPPFSSTTAATITPITTSHCPVCTCECPITSAPLPETVPETPRLVRTQAVRTQEIPMTISSTIQAQQLPAQTQPTDVLSRPESTLAANSPFNPATWHKFKVPDPLDSYVKDYLQGALRNSALGFLVNKNGSPISNAPETGYSPVMTNNYAGYSNGQVTPYANNLNYPQNAQQFSAYPASSPYPYFQQGRK